MEYKNVSLISFLKEKRKFPNCLCGINTRQLELLRWRTGRQPNICKISQSSLYSWTMYIIKTNKVLPPYAKLPCHKVAPGTPLPLNKWSHARQTFRLRCRAVGPALQTNSSNCLVLIPHWQLRNYLLGTGERYDPTGQHIQDSIQVNIWHLPREELLTEAQHSTLYRILVPTVVVM